MNHDFESVLAQRAGRGEPANACSDDRHANVARHAEPRADFAAT
jgi:hypothetical protein